MVSDKLPLISDVHFEQSPERLKVVMPVKRHWTYAAIYSLLYLVWIAMMVAGVVYVIRIAFSGERYAFVFTIILLALGYIFFRFGGFIRRQWAYYLAPREILFINKERLILRRPISVWGITDAYDMKHVSPFSMSEAGDAIAFNYGSRKVHFAEALLPEARRLLAKTLNGRFFPDHDGEVL
jgi:hypothetical protein